MYVHGPLMYMALNLLQCRRLPFINIFKLEIVITRSAPAVDPLYFAPTLL